MTLSTTPAEKEYVIGIDVGGTKLSIASVNATGQILDSQTHPTPRGDADETLAQTLSLIESAVNAVIDRMQANGYTCKGLGVAAPGPTDRKNGVLLWAPALGWEKVPLRREFEHRFHLPVQVANDIQAAALGELYFGWGAERRSGHPVQNLFWMTVSTGIGGSIVIDRKLYTGNGIAGEIGHIILEENGPTGPCGHAGCLESLASGPAIATTAREAISRDDTSCILELAGGWDNVTPPVLTQAANMGDPLARRLWQQAGTYVGKAISYVINLLDPDIVVLGGGVILGAGDFILAPIIASARQHSLARSPFPPIVQTVHGPASGVIGAATLILENSSLHP
jgi:glucokinase